MAHTFPGRYFEFVPFIEGSRNYSHPLELCLLETDPETKMYGPNVAMPAVESMAAAIDSFGLQPRFWASAMGANASCCQKEDHPEEKALRFQGPRWAKYQCGRYVNLWGFGEQVESSGRYLVRACRLQCLSIIGRSRLPM